MTVTVRFAPSPTGYLHIGNLRTALFNWLFARQRHGKFVLRYDDTDAERSRDEFAEAILADLQWIGVEPDRIEHQSRRLGLYDAAADALKAKGLLYPCYETADELDRRRKRLMAKGAPPVYGREALRLSREEAEEFVRRGRRPHWRFLLPNFDADPLQPKRTPVEWTDLVRGAAAVDLGSLSDPVLVREDGTYLYTLPSVADDGDMGVTHVIRGDDHVTNTGVQIALFRALGLRPPEFGHHNLLTTVGGEGLSKRTGALSLRSLRESGYEPMAVASLAALVGMPGSIEAVASLSDLAERVELGAVSMSASKFDPAELDRLNRDLVHALPFSAVADRLGRLGVPAPEAERFWLAVRGNCVRVADASLWRDVVFGELPPQPDFSPEDRAFLDAAFAEAPDEPWTDTVWKDWTDRVKARTGRKGKALFMPLRLAITGLDHGPELRDLLPLIGRGRLLARQPKVLP